MIERCIGIFGIISYVVAIDAETLLVLSILQMKYKEARSFYWRTKEVLYDGVDFDLSNNNDVLEVRVIFYDTIN